MAALFFTARRIFFFFQAEDGIRDLTVTGVQTCALPISPQRLHRRGRPAGRLVLRRRWRARLARRVSRSEEHTSELQSQSNLVCRLLLEKKKRSSRKSTICTGSSDCSSFPPSPRRC